MKPKLLIKIFLICNLQFVICDSSFSQPSITWQHTYPPLYPPYGYKSNGRSVCQADSNNFYLVGGTYPQGDGHEVIKINSFGDTLWTRYISYNDAEPRGISSGDGGIVCAQSGGNTFKFDMNGNLLWLKHYYIAPSQIYKIIRTHDGKYVACGQYGGWYGLIFKVDSLGNLLWYKYYNTEYWAGWYNSIIESHDNNYIAVGFRTRLENDTIRGLVTKIDTTGNIIWEKEYVLFNYNVTNLISIDRINLGYLICGQQTMDSLGRFVVDFIKIDDFGNLLFSKKFDGENNWNYVATDVKKINENKYLFCSNTQQGYLPPINSKIFLTDSLGNILSQKTFGDTSYDAILKEAYLISNGDIIFIGESGFDHPGPYGYDIMWALRTDSNLNTTPIGIKKISQNIPLHFNLWQNYPNPFNPTTKIKFELPEVRSQKLEVRLVIYDLLGRKVATLVNEKRNPGKYELEWDASNFASGIYFYSLIIDNKIIQTKKMVLNK